jgi:hypothetical protein
MRPIKARTILVQLLGAVLVVLTAIPMGTGHAEAAIGTAVSTGNGFDTCAAPSVSNMKSWWTNTPYWDANIYIGGIDRACSQPNLTASWVSQVLGIGYDLLPTWVGLQAPCSGIGQVMSSDPKTAFHQGKQNATSAAAAAGALGFANGIVYDDLEAYPTTNSTCRTAVNNFIGGWVVKLRALGWSAGVYGATCGSAVTDWASLPHPPDDLWAADWDGRASVYGLVCLSDSLWTNNHRLHQFQGNVTQTWNGVTMNVDLDCEDGLVEGVAHGNGSSGTCTYPNRTALGSPTLGSAGLPSSLRARYPDGASGSTSFVGSEGWMSVVPPHGSGVAVADLYRSMDGGRSWAPLGRHAFAGPIRFTTPLQGWALGPARESLYSSADGGRTWRAVVLPPDGQAPSGRITFCLPTLAGHTMLLPASGWDGGSFDVFASRDGGRIWTPSATLRIPASAIGAAVPFEALDSARWFVVIAGRLWTTEDGGRTWQAVTTGTPLVGATDVVFHDAEHGSVTLVVGSCRGSKSVCRVITTRMVTTDGGREWRAA